MKTRFPTPVIIIGAGPTGLGAAHMFHRSGFEDWTLFEASDTAGGLSRSIRDEAGYTWDIGGHVTFSHYDLYSRLLDDLWSTDEWLYHDRVSRVRLRDTWVPYPFQNNLHRLPPETRDYCLRELLRVAQDRTKRDTFANFDDFNLKTFGRGITEIFMRPYNFKVWGFHPRKLSADWIAERVSVPDVERVRKNVEQNRDDVAWGPNNRFRFPAHGGTGAIWTSVAGRLPQDKIKTGARVAAVDLEKHQVTLDNGETVDYGSLITTMPLDRFCRIANNDNLVRSTENLIHSSVHVIGLGLHGAPDGELAQTCWMYFPDDNCPFYRGTHFSLYSPRNVPDADSGWSLMFEVSETPDKPVDHDRVLDRTMTGAVNAGLIGSRNEIVHTFHHREEYGYPTPSLDRDRSLHALLPALAEHNVLSRGRFGAWKYEVANMDHSFMQGVEAAAHIMCGAPELTLWEPNLVNTKHPVLGWRRMA